MKIFLHRKQKEQVFIVACAGNMFHMKVNIFSFGLATNHMRPPLVSLTFYGVSCSTLFWVIKSSAKLPLWEKRDMILRNHKSRILARARNNSFATCSMCQSFIRTHFQFGVLHYMEKWNTKIIDMPKDEAFQIDGIREVSQRHIKLTVVDT